MVYTMVYQLLLHCQLLQPKLIFFLKLQAKKLVQMRFYNDGLFDNSKGTMAIILTQLQLNGL
jgi:hypothetical protein